MYILIGLLHAVPIVLIGFFARKQATVTATAIIMAIIGVMSGNPMFIAIDMLCIAIAWYGMKEHVKNKPPTIVDPEIERLRKIAESEKEQQKKLEARKDFRSFLKVAAFIIVIGVTANVMNYYSGPMHEINERKARELENWSNLDSPLWLPDFMMDSSWLIDNLFDPRYDLTWCQKANELMDDGGLVTKRKSQEREYTLKDLVDKCKEQTGGRLERIRLLATKACKNRSKHVRFEEICSRWENHILEPFLQWSKLATDTKERFLKQ